MSEPKIAGILHVCRKAEAPPALPSSNVEQLAVRVQVVTPAPRRARVVLYQGGSPVHVVMSDDAGNALITGVAPGTYEVEATRRGHKPSPRASVRILVPDLVIVVRG